MNPVAAKIAAALKARGYTDAQIAAALGTMQAESGLDPEASGDSGSAYGGFQWRGGRLKGLLDYARETGGSQADPAVQAGYFDKELRTSERGAGNKFFAAQTPQDAAVALFGYERPRGWSRKNPWGADNARGRVDGANSFYPQVAGLLSNEDPRPPPQEYTPGPGMAMAPSQAPMQSIAPSQQPMDMETRMNKIMAGLPALAASLAAMGQAKQAPPMPMMQQPQRQPFNPIQLGGILYG